MHSTQKIPSMGPCERAVEQEVQHPETKRLRSPPRVLPLGLQEPRRQARQRLKQTLQNTGLRIHARYMENQMRAGHYVERPVKTTLRLEIHNKWLQAINTRLRMDSVQTNSKIFKDKALPTKTVLRTWEKCLKDNLHETRNWCGKTGVLVGIAPKRPQGRNR